jgi:hypothetical protein
MASRGTIQATERTWRPRTGLINPRGWFILIWDICIALVLLFTALVTPFEIAFLPDEGIGYGLLQYYFITRTYK